MKDNLTYLLEKQVITEEGKRLIEEYDKRLTQNNVAVIYNLRHLRKILKIKKCCVTEHLCNTASLFLTIYLMRSIHHTTLFTLLDL